jgi:hypothetical protein
MLTRHDAAEEPGPVPTHGEGDYEWIPDYPQRTPGPAGCYRQGTQRLRCPTQTLLQLLGRHVARTKYGRELIIARIVRREVRIQQPVLARHAVVEVGAGQGRQYSKVSHVDPRIEDELGGPLKDIRAIPVKTEYECAGRYQSVRVYPGSKPMANIRQPLRFSAANISSSSATSMEA